MALIFALAVALLVNFLFGNPGMAIFGGFCLLYIAYLTGRQSVIREMGDVAQAIDRLERGTRTPEYISHQRGAARNQ